jgi:molybdopterin converting factor small subunit
LGVVLPHVVFAVNAEYADDASVIPPGASVACIPPVSGG